MNDNAPVALLNNVRKYGKRRWQAGVSVGEDIDLRAFVPSLVKGGVDSLLHVLAVEVNRRLLIGEGATGANFINNDRCDEDE